MSYAVTLNGIGLTNEPKGLELESAIQIVRDRNIPGLFTTLISDLEFWGDGYDVLLAAVQGVGICESIPITIVEDCEVNGINFEGLIFLSDIDLDLFKCTATASAEDNSLASLVLRLKDTKVRVNSGFTLNGLVLTDIGSNIGGKTWYTLEELFQHTISYITDNELTVNTGVIFGTNFLPSDAGITVLTTTSLAGTILLNYTDPVGIPVDRSIAIPFEQTIDQIAEKIALSLADETLNNLGRQAIVPYFIDRLGAVIILVSFPSFSGLTVDMGGTGTVLVGVTAGSYGLNNVVITPGSNLNAAAPQDWTISFQNVVSIGAYYNLSFEFRDTDSVQELFIDHESAFFVNTPLFTIGGAKIMQSQTAPFSFGSLQYNQQAEDVELLLFKERSYVSYSCVNSDINIAAAASPYLLEVDADAQSDKYYLAEVVGGSIASYQTSYYNGATIILGKLYRSGSILNTYVAKNYSNRAPLGLTFEGVTVTNDYPIKITKSITFDYPITRANLKAMNDNKKGYITVNGINGWINNVTSSLKTGLTQFELITE